MTSSLGSQTPAAGCVNYKVDAARGKSDAVGVVLMFQSYTPRFFPVAFLT